MIAMEFTIELDIGLSFLLQAALPQLVLFSAPLGIMSLV
jgi:hypothetical protein